MIAYTITLYRTLFIIAAEGGQVRESVKVYDDEIHNNGLFQVLNKII